MLAVTPRTARDFSDVRHAVDDVKAVIEPLTASVIHRAEPRKDFGHIRNLKFLVDGGRNRCKQLCHAVGPAVIRGRMIEVTTI